MSNMNVNALTMTASENVTFNGVNANLILAPTGTGAIILTSAAAGPHKQHGNRTNYISKTDLFVNLNAQTGLNNTVIRDVTPKECNFISVVLKRLRKHGVTGNKQKVCRQ